MPAPGGHGLHGEGGGFFRAEDVCFLIAAAALPRDKGRAEGPHQPGDIRPGDGHAQFQFQGAKQAIIDKGTALHNHMLAQLFKIAELHDFVAGVTHHGIAQPRGDIADFGPFFLGLFDLGVHEHRAPRAQVHRIFRL